MDDSGSHPSLKVLFLSEGLLGTIMGHATYDASLLPVLERLPDVEARFAGLPEQSRPVRALWRSAPYLGKRDLDMQPVRWHAVHAELARRVLRDQLESFDPDVVHARSHVIVFGMLRQMRRVPVVPVVDATVWDWRAMAIWRPVRPQTRPLLWPSEAAERAVLRRAPLVLAMNEWTEAAIRRAVPEANVVKNHPGIDLERFRPAEREERSRLRVLFVGGRFESKGGLDLLDALGERLGDDVELDVVSGDPVPEREGVRAHRLSQDDPRLLALYQQADVFCLPTHADSNPWVLLEAMGCGTPAITTDIAGIPEIMGHGAGGPLIQPGDREGLRRELYRLLDDADHRHEVGERALAHVRERFDARRNVPAMLDLLSGVAAQGARPSGSRAR